MIKFNPYTGLRTGTSEAGKQLVQWMFSQPPFNRKPYKTYDPEAEWKFISAVLKMGTLPPDTKEADFNHPENKQIIRACLEVQKKGLALSIQNIGDQLRFEEYGPYYSETAVLSAILAGAEIPGSISESVFYDPRNRILFRAMKHLKLLGILNFSCLVDCLNEFGVLQKCGGRAYLTKIEYAMPIPYAIGSLTIVLLKEAIIKEVA
jgi:hypothetical protein